MSCFCYLRKMAVFLLIPLAILPAECYAGPRNANPAANQKKVEKLGLGHWIQVKEKNGRTLTGIIIGFGHRSFQIQLHNSSEIVGLSYADVLRVRGDDLTSKRALAFWALTAGVAVGAGFIVHSQF